MTPDFKIGNRVHHSGMHEDGTVTHVRDGVVRVEFDRKSSLGSPVIGEYDEVWFNTHEGWLRPLSNGDRNSG